MLNDERGHGEQHASYQTTKMYRKAGTPEGVVTSLKRPFSLRAAILSHPTARCVLLD